MLSKLVIFVQHILALKDIVFGGWHAGINLANENIIETCLVISKPQDFHHYCVSSPGSQLVVDNNPPESTKRSTLVPRPHFGEYQPS